MRWRGAGAEKSPERTHSAHRYQQEPTPRQPMEYRWTQNNTRAWHLVSANLTHVDTDDSNTGIWQLQVKEALNKFIWKDGIYIEMGIQIIPA